MDEMKDVYGVKIEAGDLIRHLPTKEVLTVCGVDLSGDYLIPCWYPFPTRLDTSDCELLEKRTEPQTKAMKDTLRKYGLLEYIEYC